MEPSWQIKTSKSNRVLFEFFFFSVKHFTNKVVKVIVASVCQWYCANKQAIVTYNVAVGEL